MASSSVLRQRSSSPIDRSAEASATRTDTCRSVSPLGKRRSAASNQRAAASGARALADLPASSRSSIAASSPRRADCSTWWARSVACAPRAARRSAARACAASRQPARDESYTARRTSGWRKANRRGTWVGRTRSRSSRSSGEVGLEWLAGHGRGLQEPPRGVLQRGELSGDRACHRGRDAPVALAANVGGGKAAPLGRAAQLLEIEGVAASVAVGGGHRRRVESVEELPGLVRTELGEIEPRNRRRREGAGQPLRGGPRAKAQCEQHGPGGRAARQRGDQLE